MKRIYFMGIIVVDGCNPNGDPTCDNRPRIDYEGYGEISSVCLKRKIRNALCFAGYDIFVRDDLAADKFPNQKKRATQIKAETKELEWRNTDDGSRNLYTCRRGSKL